MNKKLKCKICGLESNNLTTHIIRTHKMTCAEYKIKYNVSVVMYHSPEVRDKILSKLKITQNSIEYKKLQAFKQKEGASIFTIKYWINKGFSEKNAIEKIKEIQFENFKKRLLKYSPEELKKQSCLNKDFWIKQGFTEVESIKIISDRQKFNGKNSSRFSGKKRTDEEKLKISNSMKFLINRVGKEKWTKHFGKNGPTSKVEIEFFNYIKNNINNLVESNVWVDNKYVVDVIVDKKIIEFFGDYWHANPIKDWSTKKINPEEIRNKDKNRIDYLTKIGYTVLVIWENDWYKNKQNCIEKIKNFLNENN